MSQVSGRVGPSAVPKRASKDGLRRFVETFAEEHPPLSLDAADLTIKNPEQVRRRYGGVFNYLTRVELEVERNVLELRALMPDATEIDRLFYEDVWSPQELQHGILLDAVQQGFGMVPAATDLEVSAKIRLVGVLSHLPGMLAVVRLLYYLTGAATERSAVVAYSRLVDGLRAMGEHAIAETVIAPIRRQEPGHFAFYRLSAEALVGEEGLSDWQVQLARILRRRSFELVGVNNRRQRADFGDVARALDFDRDLLEVARQVSRVERELLWAQHQGLKVPTYILTALQEAISLSTARSTGRF
ncbi:MULTISPECIES: GTP-binding protein LepA [unclassified Kribbella]|uniref:GTP-binding protein LepA n=1 Tax=unclassified Kribbella TaxID=2644121 RepID=UPI003076CFD9